MSALLVVVPTWVAVFGLIALALALIASYTLAGIFGPSPNYEIACRDQLPALTVSRLPVRSWRNHDLTSHREERGVLQTDIELGSQLLHVFNVHLGTGFNERRRQARLLLGEKILTSPQLTSSRLVVGDLNEWTRGLTTHLLRDTFQTFSPRHTLRLPATFPGLLPAVTLDHCYFEPPLELLETHLFRTPTALIASDHLPLIADFTLA